MAYSVTRVENFNTYCIYHFLCDSSSDLATIVSDYTDKGLRAGWAATTTGGDTTKAFILGNDLSTWASYDASGVLSEVPVADGGGWDSTVQKTINRPEDVDSHGNPIDRTNTVTGNFGCAYGSRNTVSGSESGAFGGKNTVEGEDSFAFGYDNHSTNNQNFTGGYLNYNHGRETFVFGNSNTQESGDNSKYNAIFGDNNTIGSNTRRSMVVGNSNTIPGNNSGINQHIYLMGLSNNSDYDHTYLFGHHLKAVEQGQFVVGAYNKGTSNCWFEVGCGTNANNRNTAFAVLDYSGTRSIKIGNTELTEAQLQSLLALI